MKEFKKELLNGNVSVLIETAKQAEDLVAWIYANVDKKYPRLKCTDWNRYIGKYVCVDSEFGNCYNFYRTHSNFVSFDEALKEAECMFEKYGFEVPDFECEIYAMKDNFQIIGSVKKLGDWYPISWDKIDGTVYTFNSSYCEDYNLTPIKKESFIKTVQYYDDANDKMYIVERKEVSKEAFEKAIKGCR